MANSAAIIDLAKQGIKPARIATDLGCNTYTVYEVIRQARRDGVVIPQFTRRHIKPKAVPTTGHVAVPVRLMSLLEREAERLGIGPSDLAGKLLEDGLLKSAVRHD